jgi:hypothetical protein
MIDITDLRSTIVPKSDQLNAEQLLTGPMTIKVTGVTVSNNAEQPVAIAYEGDDGRPYKPCKTMRKVLILAWGHNGSEWAGKSITLYNDPAVKFGGQSVGGIRISHVSHIDKDFGVALTATKGKKTLHTIKALKVAAPVNAKATAARYTAMIANDQAGVVARELAAMDDAKRDDIWQHFTEEQQGILTMEWPEAA